MCEIISSKKPYTQTDQNQYFVLQTICIIVPKFSFPNYAITAVVLLTSVATYCHCILFSSLKSEVKQFRLFEQGFEQLKNYYLLIST